MALIDTQTFALSRWWLQKGLEIIPTQRDIFSGAKMRQARMEFVAGKNMLSAIKGWMLAAQLISENKGYFLTDFGEAISSNDPKLKNAATWWAIHLSICFSDRKEPYASLFRTLDVTTRDWISWKKPLLDNIHKKLDSYSEKAIEQNLDGVLKMFTRESPLSDLGLLEFRKLQSGNTFFRLGKPEINDFILLYALALARFHIFKNRTGIHFNELLTCGLNHFLCLSPEDLRKRLQTLSRSARWQSWISFTQVNGLDSLQILNEDFNHKKMLLLLLQETEDTWL